MKVRLSVTPSVASLWLFARLAKLERDGLHIDLSLEHRLADFGEGTDLAIRRGKGPWAGVRAIALWQEKSFPIATPSLAEQLAETVTGDRSRPCRSCMIPTSRAGGGGSLSRMCSMCPAVRTVGSRTTISLLTPAGRASVLHWLGHRYRMQQWRPATWCGFATGKQTIACHSTSCGRTDRWARRQRSSPEDSFVRQGAARWRRRLSGSSLETTGAALAKSNQTILSPVTDDTSTHIISTIPTIDCLRGAELQLGSTTPEMENAP